MLLLTTTGHLVQLAAGTAGALDCHVSYIDNNSGAITPAAVDIASITGTSATTIVASPGSGVQRNVKNISINNNSGTVTTTITVTHYDGTNTETLYYASLGPNETVVMDEVAGWSHYDANGNPYSTGVPLTTVGDVLGFGTAPARLAVGSNATVLTADANQPLGIKWGVPVMSNVSTSTVSAGFASDTYLAGSSITMPDDGPLAGTQYYLCFDMVKTGAGTAAPVITVRFGTNGTTADTAILTFTLTAGTAVADTGKFELHLHFRTVGTGTSAVVVGTLSLNHQLTNTGLVNSQSYVQVTTVSSGFNSTPAGSILGVSFNGGTSFSGTCTLVEASAIKLN